MLGVSLSLSLSPCLSPGCCCPTESTARPAPVYYYLFKPIDSTCTASTQMNWFAVWEATGEAGRLRRNAAELPCLKHWGVGVAEVVWENAFLLGKGGREWQRRGEDTDCIRNGVIERVMNRRVQQMAIVERPLGQQLNEGSLVGLASVILGNKSVQFLMPQLNTGSLFDRALFI